jgi:hypothetical protein
MLNRQSFAPLGKSSRSAGAATFDVPGGQTQVLPSLTDFEPIVQFSSDRAALLVMTKATEAANENAFILMGKPYENRT